MRRVVSFMLIIAIVFVAYCKFEQWKQVNQVDPPTPRYNFDGACYEDKMLVFGGRGDTWFNFTADAHLFDFSSKNWEHLHFGNESSPGIAPRPRFGAQIAVIKGNLYMFGGAYYDLDNRLVYLNDTWKFNFASKFWSPEQTLGFVPPLYEAQIFPFEASDYFCVWGGHNDDKSVFDKTYCYNVNTKAWTDESSTFKNTPYGRFGAMTQTIEDGKHIMFGGRTFMGSKFYIKPVDFLNDAWIIDMNTKKWNEIKIPMDMRPKQRYNAQGAIIKDKKNKNDYLVMYGGEILVDLSDKPYNPTYDYLVDTWVLNLKTEKWTEVTKEAGTAPMGRSAGITCVHDNKIFMWGGKRNYKDPEEVLYNDMWVVNAESLLSGSNTAELITEYGKMMMNWPVLMSILGGVAAIFVLIKAIF